MSHIYRPLRQQDNEIRLFQMYFGNLDQETLEGELKYVDLNSGTEFYAVSYCCGGTTPLKTIIVDGKPLQIYSNTEQVLRTLLANQVGLVWVDQICINQDVDGIDEKNAQILRIASVYQEATTVVIWLGPHYDGSEDVMQWNRSTIDVDSLLKDPSMCKKIVSFFTRPYWKRSWVVQEFMAATELQFWCGTDILNSENFESLVRSLYNYRLETEPLYANQLTTVDLPVRQEAEVFAMCITRSAQRRGHPYTLLRLLQIFCRTDAHNPLDKVYAFLGLAWDRSHYIAEPSYRIPSQQRLCLEMGRAAMLRKRSLDNMFLAGKQSAERNLPSWCPYYTQFKGTSITTRLVYYLASEREQYRLGAEGYRWETTLTSIATESTFSIEDFVLITEAYKVDEIRSLGELEGEDGDHQHDNNKLPFKDEILLMESLSRAMAMYDKNYSRYSTIPSQPHLLFSWAFRMQGQRQKVKSSNDILQEWRERHSDFKMAGKPLSQHAGTLKQYKAMYETTLKPARLTQAFKAYFDPEVSLTAAWNMEQITNALADIVEEGLRLMVTANGWVGWAHPDARANDQIFLMPGCTMPAILRPIDKDHYSLVGHCYVDGLMSGRVWDGLLFDGPKPDRIRIR